MFCIYTCVCTYVTSVPLCARVIVCRVFPVVCVAATQEVMTLTHICHPGCTVSRPELTQPLTFLLHKHLLSTQLVPAVSSLFHTEPSPHSGSDFRGKTVDSVQMISDERRWLHKDTVACASMRVGQARTRRLFGSEMAVSSVPCIRE